MLDQTNTVGQLPHSTAARNWIKVLAKYRAPSLQRSVFELSITMVPFLGLWAAAWWAMSVSYVLTLLIALVNAAFLLRLFAIQHDCGHGSFFESRGLSDWVGRGLGVLTLTPYDVWRRTHSIHHSSSGNLSRRGIGDIHTMTVAEYNKSSAYQRFVYRLYRNPLVLFGLGPAYLFLLQQRLPLGLTEHARYWVSAMATNAVLFAILGLIYAFGGVAPILLIFLPTTLLAATAGMWLFYVQHQFEDAHWETDENWEMHEAALHGSSHYVLPPVLQWLSANIGIHHVHHLYSRIPFYRLTEVLKDHAELAECNRMTIKESFTSVRLHLWDEDSKQLMSFSDAKAT